MLFGVRGRVCESTPAGPRQGTTLNELPAHCKALCGHLGVRDLAQGLFCVGSESICLSDEKK